VCLVNGFTNRVVHRAILRFTNVVRDVDRFGVVNRFRNIAICSELLRLHDSTTYCLHHRHCSTGCRATHGTTDRATIDNCSVRNRAANYGTTAATVCTVTNNAIANSTVTHCARTRVATAVTRRTAMRGLGELAKHDSEKGC